MIREVTLGESSGPGAIKFYTPVVSRDSRGRYLVMDAGAVTPQLFDAAGRFLRVVGAIGTGPGEFRRAGNAMFGPGDSIVVLGPGAFSVFSPAGEFVRRDSALTRGVNFTLLPDGRLFHLGGVPTLTGGGHSFHIVTTTGEVTRSFGDTTESRPHRLSLNGVMVNSSQQVAPSTAGTFWSWSTLLYRLSRMDTLANVREVFTGTPRWYTEDIAPTNPPVVRDIREDGRRILWVLGWRPAPGWQDRMPKPDANGNVVGGGSPIGNKTTVLEAIDLEKGTVLATLRLPSMALKFVDAERVAILVEAGGVPRTEIWRVELAGFMR